MDTEGSFLVTDSEPADCSLSIENYQVLLINLHSFYERWSEGLAYGCGEGKDILFAINDVVEFCYFT
jgi:hypothetical protein